MRCKHCGGDISLETAFCPYCGQPNEHAQQHVREMKKFRRSYENTKSGVHNTVKNRTGISVRVAIIAVLIVLSVLLLIVGGKAYSIRRAWIQNRTEKNAGQMMQTMDALLEAEEFSAFSAFCEENYIESYGGTFESYAPVIWAAGTYCYVYGDIMSVLMPAEWQEPEQTVESLSDNLELFYDALNMEKYEYYEGADNEQNRKALAAMDENVTMLLEAYFGLSHEEAESLKTMSEARRALMLEEAISDAR